MRLDKVVYKSEDYKTMKIKGESKTRKATFGKSRKWEVELQKSDSESIDKFECLYQPLISKMNCPQPFGDLLVIKVNTREFFLVNPLITSGEFGWVKVSKGSCVSFKP